MTSEEMESLIMLLVFGANFIVSNCMEASKVVYIVTFCVELSYRSH